MEVLYDNTNKHVEHKETDEQDKGNEVQESPLVVVDNRLLVYTDCVQTSVHNVHPAIAGTQHKQRHQCFAQVIEIVLSIDPSVTRYTETLAFVAHILDVLSLAVEEGALEQLHSQYTEDDKERATDENDIANRSKGR